MASSSFISRYGSQMWLPCLIRTKTLISANEKSHRVLTTPGQASSSNGENYVVLLFSERPIADFLFETSKKILLTPNTVRMT